MKITKKEAFVVKPNKNTLVYSYPSNNKNISIAFIKVNGRHPENNGEYFIETKCHLLFYFLKGLGKVMIKDQEFRVKSNDAVIVKSGDKYYLEGNFEYLVSTSPMYSPDQNKIVR